MFCQTNMHLCYSSLSVLTPSWTDAILLGVCHISHGECRKCHGCWKSEWYTKLLHHKDIHPFASNIKKQAKSSQWHFLIIFPVVSSTLLIFPSNTKMLLNNKSKEHRLHCYSFAWRWNLLNFVALPKGIVICNAGNRRLLFKLNDFCLFICMFFLYSFSSHKLGNGTNNNTHTKVY